MRYWQKNESLIGRIAKNKQIYAALLWIYRCAKFSLIRSKEVLFVAQQPIWIRKRVPAYTPRHCRWHFETANNLLKAEPLYLSLFKEKGILSIISRTPGLYYAYIEQEKI